LMPLIIKSRMIGRERKRRGGASKVIDYNILLMMPH
jgi:hypothetical protein